MAKAKRNARKDEKAARPKPAALAPEEWPARRVEMRPVEWLKPHPRNVRTHPVRQLSELDLSIAEHGMVKPIVANTGGEILAGHGGVDSLTHLHGRGIEVPVVVVDWPEEKQRSFMLRDNAIALLSGWDGPRLGGELADLSAMAVDVNHLGFKAPELKKLMGEMLREGLHDPDREAPAAPAEAVARPGDVWLLGEHRLMCGDSTKLDHVEALLAGARPHLMVTDPPYGVEYDPDWRNRAGLNNGGALGEVANDDRADWREAWALFPGDVVYVWHSALYASVVQASLEACGFALRSQIIWDKTRLIIGRGDYHWQHEPAWYAVRNGGTSHWAGDRSQTTFWEIPSTVWPISHGKSETGHGTQKPIECMARPMRNNSAPGDHVYEPFSGSGSTIIAAEQLGRRVLAMEILPAYVDVAVKRWEGFTGKNAILATTGAAGWVAAAAERGVRLAA
jgi:DNA modification methylase